MPRRRHCLRRRGAELPQVAGGHFEPSRIRRPTLAEFQRPPIVMQRFRSLQARRKRVCNLVICPITRSPQSRRDIGIPAVEIAVDQGRGGVEAIVEHVLRQTSNVGPCLMHDSRAVAPGDVDATGGADRRREHVGRFVEALELVMRLAGLRVETRRAGRCWSSGCRARRRRRAETAHRACHDSKSRRRGQCRDVARGARDLDRLQTIALESAGRKHHSVLEHRRGNRVHRQSGGFPDHGAGWRGRSCADVS